jgi:hypothetical protein
MTMERFRFGEQEGPNGKKTTLNGWLAFFGPKPWPLGGEIGPGTLEISGPNGGVRAMVMMDQDTARKLGAALLKWAGADLVKTLQDTLINLEDFLDQDGEFEWTPESGRSVCRDIEKALAAFKGTP